jgi:hypothetical protein
LIAQPWFGWLLSMLLVISGLLFWVGWKWLRGGP